MSRKYQVAVVMAVLLQVVDRSTSLPTATSTTTVDVVRNQAETNPDTPETAGPSVVSRIGTPDLNTGYSKVAILGDDPSPTDPNVIPGDGKGVPKSMGGKAYDEGDDDEDGTSSYSEIGSSLSAKDSLAIFMRKHLHSPVTSMYQPMAAKLTLEDGSSETASALPMKEEELSSLMKSRLSDFVKEYMGGLLKAEIQEVRVEQRTNGLREYNES